MICHVHQLEKELLKTDNEIWRIENRMFSRKPTTSHLVKLSYEYDTVRKRERQILNIIYNENIGKNKANTTVNGKV